MNLYNYVAGGEFPPRLPDRFSPYKFGHIDVVVFVLEGEKRHEIGNRLAGPLQVSRELRGLVYSYGPENRDYLRCADFFVVSAFPSCVVVAYPDMSEIIVNGRRALVRSPLQHWKDDDIRILSINADGLIRRPGDNVAESILEHARQFIESRNAVDTPNVRVRHVPRCALALAAAETPTLRYASEINVFFTRPAWRHTEFERAIYDTFIEFGATTDDVLVRVLYPSHVSDAYESFLRKSGVVKLPAAVFRSSRRKQVTVRVDRDILQRVVGVPDRLRYLISDLHRTVGLGLGREAQRLVDELEAHTGLQLVFHPSNVVPEDRVHIQIHRLEGDLVLGNKHETI
jgi:hypothetical protein